jgi:hypothetical protein
MKRKTNKDEELLAKAIPFTRIEDYAGANNYLSVIFVVLKLKEDPLIY